MIYCNLLQEDAKYQIEVYLRMIRQNIFRTTAKRWTRFWMQFAGTHAFGRLAARLASWGAPPHKERVALARMHPRGYIEPTATIHHSKFRFGGNIFIGDRVIILQRERGGPVELGDYVCIYRDTIIETGYGGSLILGAHSSIHPRCQLNAYVASIKIGNGVMVAPGCAFYPYDHGIEPDKKIRQQPLQTKGDIVVGDEAWLSYGVIVLSGVKIGSGAVIGAGSVVTSDIPDGAIAVGAPARVVKMRNEVALHSEKRDGADEMN
jgi:acetyltransferase-like isoleucine patch superfamily enzyme